MCVSALQGISLIVIKSFASQLLQTLQFLKKLNVIHCDLKPENILLQHPSMSKIKVIDFGSSCFYHEKGRMQKPSNEFGIIISFL